MQDNHEVPQENHSMQKQLEAAGATAVAKTDSHIPLADERRFHFPF